MIFYSNFSIDFFKKYTVSSLKNMCVKNGRYKLGK